MNKKIKATIFAVAVVAAGFGGYKAYDYSETQKQSLMAYNVEAQSQGLSGLGDWVQNTFIQPVENWWESLVWDANEVTITQRVKVGASVSIPKGAVIVEIDGEYYYEWTKKCNECVRGNTYAHWWEIPNPC